MQTSLERLSTEALALGFSERAELANLLFESLAPEELDRIGKIWNREAGRRLNEVQSGEVTTVPGDEVMAEARRIAQGS